MKLFHVVAVLLSASFVTSEQPELHAPAIGPHTVDAMLIASQ